MKRSRIVLVLVFATALALFGWYRNLPTIVVLGDGLFIETEWAQGDHALFFPLLKKGWRMSVRRVDRLPLESDELVSLMDSQHAQVLVTSPRLTNLIDKWHIAQPAYRLAGLADSEVGSEAFDVVFLQDFTQGYREAAESPGPPHRLISSSPVPQAIADLFPVREMVDGNASEVQVRSMVDAWLQKGEHRDLIVYDVANLSLYGVPMIVPAKAELSLSNDQILGLIVTDYTPLETLAVPYPKTRKKLTLTLESHFRSAARMSGGYLAQALVEWKRKFL